MAQGPAASNGTASPRLRSDAFIRRVLFALEGVAHDYLADYLRDQESAIRRQVMEEITEDRAYLERVTAEAESLKTRRLNAVARAARKVERHRAVMNDVRERLQELLASIEETPTDVLVEELESCVSSLARVAEIEVDDD
ncbi:MAG: hypothetical protein C0501_30485 [Isosphaera sp.]|nr:hypothetical protein [Isosphaera sp.]